MRRQNITAAMEYTKKTILTNFPLTKILPKKKGGTKTALCHMQHPKILQKICFHAQILYDVLLCQITLLFLEQCVCFSVHSSMQKFWCCLFIPLQLAAFDEELFQRTKSFKSNVKFRAWMKLKFLEVHDCSLKGKYIEIQAFTNKCFARSWD